MALAQAPAVDGTPAQISYKITPIFWTEQCMLRSPKVHHVMTWRRINGILCGVNVLQITASDGKRRQVTASDEKFSSSLSKATQPILYEYAARTRAAHRTAYRARTRGAAIACWASEAKRAAWRFAKIWERCGIRREQLRNCDP
eukprot:5478362-Pleurochrysis_carterae.AAC.2